MARKQSTGRRIGMHGCRVGRGLPDLFPDSLDVSDELQDRGRRLRDPAEVPLLSLDDGELRRSAVPRRLLAALRLSIRSCFRSAPISLACCSAIPAAWSMAFAPTKRTKDVSDVDAVDENDARRRRSSWRSIFLFLLGASARQPLGRRLPSLMMANLPIIVWMLYTYFKEIPVDILEAARMDGASLANEIIYVLTPMAVPGITSTMLLCDHPVLERSLLDAQSDQCQTRRH